MPKREPSSVSKAAKPDAKQGPAEQRRLQMADIARLAGVSMSTVSRALSGSPLVNAETRQRVAELARSLNYSINLGAQNLRLQKNRIVAVVVPYEAASRQHISDPFFLALVGSIADALTDQGYDMLLSRVDAEHLDLAAQFYDSGKAVGVIMVGQWRHHDQLNALATRQLPLVVWGGALPQQLYCTVGGDNTDGGLQATRHLLQLGRRRIAFLGDAQLPEVWLRREGYLQALQEAKLPAEPALALALPFEPSAARTAIEQWLPEAPAFDAVLACSDLLALQAIHCLRARGQRVPEDVAVVGYDDMPLAAYCDPPLSTVHQPVAEAGAELVAALMAQLRGTPSPSRTLGVKLIVRHSTG
ncbi:LacI family DNA-binding transcriptional regulator [Paucibacter sp. Y2R2-4]|uniref:LacI family DNA-binding transcriptional regulator n=1 Tax=Paucibacter sp. Y2R2-4 TaxID=2893553 RepID=UPI0021E3DAD3|nr:LacI family DNA-binding transcriptional regulator [Paucibacter sp. Y2R2-4]MCV2351182.1 LacI family DNA-binding transcriptional regulator [Paucibacter sp. Y2R2-4]